MSISPVRVWSLQVIALVTIFTNFFAGIVLAVLNWRRMGLDEKAKYWLRHGIAALLVFIPIIVFVPSVIFSVSIGANVLTYFLLQRAMKADIETFRANNPNSAPAPWLSGCGVGLVVSLALGMATVVITVTLSGMGIPLPE